jgi:hypothetical protein
VGLRVLLSIPRVASSKLGEAKVAGKFKSILIKLKFVFLNN